MVLCRTSRKKIQWYLDRGLADVITSNVIRLKFEPNGRRNATDLYYLADKENRCVVCGSIENLNLHHIVPRCYRKYFPPELKDHSSHDVVATCEDCHKRYETHALQFKIEIGEKYGCPIGATTVDRSLLRVCKSAHALLKHQGTIPEPKRQMLLDVVVNYLGKTPDHLELKQLTKINAQCQVNDHGKVIVSIVNIQEFTEQWRNHFMAVMQPRFLPCGWDPKRNDGNSVSLSNVETRLINRILKTLAVLPCWFGFHEWSYGEDVSRVRPLKCSDRRCVHCPATGFYADRMWYTLKD